jgi:hypothetical protein
MIKSSTEFVNSTWIRDRQFSAEKNIKNIHTFVKV